MKLWRKPLNICLALAYLAAPALAPMATAAPAPGVACLAGACHCKSMRPGHPCCCLLSKKIPLAKTYAFKKGDPPCMTEGSCGQAWAPISQARPELAPQAQRLAFLNLAPSQDSAIFRPLSQLPDKALDKVPLAA